MSSNSNQNNDGQDVPINGMDTDATNGVHHPNNEASNSTSTTPEPGTENGHTADDSDQQQERELTQTDHLNKKLLSSFLHRINSAGFPMPSTASGEGDENQDFSDKEDEQNNGLPDIIPTN